MNNKGFSLVEVLVAIAIFGIFMTALVAFFIAEYNQYKTQKDIIAMQNNARASIDFFTRMIRNSNSTVPTIENNTNCSHSITFYDINDEVHVFELIGTDFRYTAPGSSTQPYASNIGCFNVEWDSDNKKIDVEIGACLAKNNSCFGNPDFTLFSTIRPRNM